MIEHDYVVGTNRKAAVFFAVKDAMSAVSTAVAPTIIHAGTGSLVLIPVGEPCPNGGTKPSPRSEQRMLNRIVAGQHLSIFGPAEKFKRPSRSEFFRPDGPRVEWRGRA